MDAGLSSAVIGIFDRLTNTLHPNGVPSFPRNKRLDFETQVTNIERITLVITLRLSLDEYNYGSKLYALLGEEMTRPSVPSRRGHTVKYKSRQPHHDEPSLTNKPPAKKDPLRNELPADEPLANAPVVDKQVPRKKRNIIHN